jgi:hypothetical protein
MRKGQAALEFLMTYGWAILVVLAAIAALAYFGVLSPDRFLPSKCTATGGFSCGEYKIDGTAQEIQLNIQNNLGVDADNVTVRIVDGSDCDVVEDAGLWSQPLENGKSTGLLTFTCASFPASKLKADIEITYTRAGETVTHEATGTLSGQVES